MSGVILALLEQQSAAQAVLAAARLAARLTGAARIDVLAVRAPSIDIMAATEGFVSFKDDAAGRAAEAARIGALHQAFRAWAGAHAGEAPTATWLEREGWADQVLEDMGPAHSLIVMQRPGGGDRVVEHSTIRAALFDTGRPVLLVPPQDFVGFGKHVAVAWRNDTRTVHAVSAALQWLRGAEFHILAGAKRWETPPALPSLFAQPGIQAQLHVLPMGGQRGFGETLLARARAVQADLLVLGAFAHPMLFGPLLGGVTKYMLAQADLPVLMQY